MNIRSFASAICFAIFATFVQSADVNSVTNVTSSTNVATLNTTNIVNTVNVTNIVTQTNIVEKAVEKTGEKPVAAIFVINNLGENDLKYVFDNVTPQTLEDQTDIFRNILSSRLGGNGFGIVNQDVVLAALKKAKFVDENEDLYSKLQEKNTAQQLADLVGANYLIIGRLLGLEYEENHFERGKIKTDMMIYTLHSGYEVIDGNDGSSFISGSYEAQKKERITGNRNGEGSIKKFSNNRLLSLYRDSSVKINDDFQKKLAEMGPIPASSSKGLTYFRVECVLANISDLPLTLPLFWINNDGTIGTPKKGIQNLQIYIDGVGIDVDGVLLGTSDEVLDGKSGIHTLQISRTGMNTIEKRVNFKKGATPDRPQVFRIALQPTEEEMQTLKQNILFFQDLLERNKKLDGKLRLTEALAKEIEAHGQMLAQSGYRVTVDEQYRGKSPYDGGVIKWNQVLEDGIRVH